MEAATMHAPQHMHALDKANAVRMQRAEMVRRMRCGELKVTELLEHPAFKNMLVVEFLLRVPRRGPTRNPWRKYSGTHRKVRRMTQEIGATEAQTIGGLTARQRERLVGLLPAWLSG